MQDAFVVVVLLVLVVMIVVVKKRREPPAIAAARAVAMEHLRSSHSTFAVTNATLRVEEQRRYVFAVFYNELGEPVVPSRYRLLAVAKDAGTVEVLDMSPASPYRIRGFR